MNIGRSRTAASVGLAAAISLTLVGSAAWAQTSPMSAATEAVRTVSVNVEMSDEDGQQLTLSGQQAEMHAGHLYVPLRAVVEKMGYAVDWDSKAQTVVVTNGDSALSMPVGGRTTVNGNPINPGAPAYLSDGKIMVPLRFMSEMLGAKVRWDARGQIVRISRPSAAVVASAS